MGYYKSIMPNLIEKRYRRWYAVLDVPKSIQSAIGKRRYFHKLETESESVAIRRAAPLVARWKSAIAAARAGTDDPVEADVLFWRSALAEDMDETSEMATKDALLEHAEKIESENKGRGSTLYKRALGLETGTLEHLDEWVATLEVEPKTKDMSRANVLRMAARFPTI
ncbi:MAG: hypothetical protein JKY20_09040 [Alphaproteobacteria bacterium]|nr:hypothetical protein [Alphaproteobacteria bacterium]